MKCIPALPTELKDNPKLSLCLIGATHYWVGDRTEVIAGPAESRAGGDQGSPIETILEMARRRPVRVTDIAKTLKISAEETDRLVKGLLIKGRISKQEHLGENFFIAK